MRTAIPTTFFVTHRDGSTSADLDITDLGWVLAQLDERDGQDQPSVALTHDSGWTLRAFPSGRLILSKPGEPRRQLDGATRELVAGLWASLAAGDIDTLDAQPWRTLRI